MAFKKVEEAKERLISKIAQSLYFAVTSSISEPLFELRRTLQHAREKDVKISKTHQQRNKPRRKGKGKGSSKKVDIESLTNIPDKVVDQIEEKPVCPSANFPHFFI